MAPQSITFNQSHKQTYNYLQPDSKENNTQNKKQHIGIGYSFDFPREAANFYLSVLVIKAKFKHHTKPNSTNSQIFIEPSVLHKKLHQKGNQLNQDVPKKKLGDQNCCREPVFLLQNEIYQLMQESCQIDNNNDCHKEGSFIEERCKNSPKLVPHYSFVVDVAKYRGKQIHEEANNESKVEKQTEERNRSKYIFHFGQLHLIVGVLINCLVIHTFMFLIEQQ